jgi:nickel-dependent lactate racemase
MVDVWLPYGKTEVCARIPTRSYLGTITPKEKPGVGNPRAEITRALKDPVGTTSLSDTIKPGDRVAIVVDDATRATPTSLMLPPLLDELNILGVKDESISIVFACGTHRAVSAEEMTRILGEQIIGRVKAVSHDCESKDCIYVGKTSFKTKVEINRVFAEADRRILTGDVNLHYYAGYGGGRKSVLPGVASEATIQHNHSMLMNPKAQTGVLDGNPVHEDMVEAAKLSKVDFVLNIVTNSRQELVKAFSGDLEQTFCEGVKLVDEMYKVPIERRADIVVVSSGGHPFDINLFQAQKGINNVLDSVKKGGVIVFLAECPEGHGNDVFYDWSTRFREFKEVEDEIRRHFVMGGHKTYYLMKTLQKYQIILVSILPDYQVVNVFRLKAAKAINDGVHDAFGIAGKNAKVWAVPFGNLTLPITTSSQK